ncbi:DUF1501 domain-containing protein [Burkholderiaceae bacterium FT117]|uniref:DUF1501 domain-containing protein n=1 Tax=Zeimonas sediminis TaxID=2944268 RepID=UPI00234316CC|nr:DUF1501 domain-containing protein [Zeimonas sediminis]MCM5569771.1 DUF1501 domain-containing protein [Zeimonas sediminis]
MSLRNASRRRFVRTASALSIAGPAGLPFALNLAAIGAAAAQTSGDYRALVCLFMFGGNDSHNMVLATDPDSWTAYRAVRSVAPSPIALPAPGEAGGVLPITPVTAQPGRSFALHPNMGALRDLFAAGRAAVVANVGPLIAPTSKQQYVARSVPLPPKLFSHNDQQSTWQAHAPEGARVGWGGRLGDLLASANGNATFTCISASGNAVWLSGESTLQYQVGAGGAVAIGGLTGGLFGASASANPLQAIVAGDRTNLFEKEYNRVTRRSIDAQQALNAAMVPAAGLEAPPDGNGLASQLLTVARLIGGRAALGARRQVFFVSIGGFDTHDNQTANHGTLMGRVSQAIAYFDRLLASPAVNALAETTLFTASDFGRTLTSNGDGTDHGWGAHHLVVGGSVRGGDLYGRYPVIGVGTQDDVGQGRLLPAQSVDQYGATLARWFGLSDAQIADVFPNIGNFSARDLGFMA